MKFTGVFKVRRIVRSRSSRSSAFSQYATRSVSSFWLTIIRHSKFAANRFAHEAAPALTQFADSSPGGFIAGVKTARERIVARTAEDREEFLRRRGFSKGDTSRVIQTVLAEEGHPPASLYDFVQGITAVARTRPHQDARLELE